MLKPKIGYMYIDWERDIFFIKDIDQYNNFICEYLIQSRTINKGSQVYYDIKDFMEYNIIYLGNNSIAKVLYL